MTFIEIIATFSHYGIDVILLAAATSVLLQILKLGILKNAPKKVLTFLPFVLGTLLYAIYVGVNHFSLSYIAERFAHILKEGTAVGALSTFIYVLYEQFIRKSRAKTPEQVLIAAMLEGYVPAEKAEIAAEALTEAAESGQMSADEAAEILSEYAEGATAQEIALLAKLIERALECV